ncbi:mitochondrial ribosomal protein S10 [Scheffersomyces coipomensis]|uniref:mitochondrial ribosomal protein S10 n=1 Tax=Scheffersomyces coipomensis TaxID=1788519 RepID=UPI00315D2ABB
MFVVRRQLRVSGGRSIASFSTGSIIHKKQDSVKFTSPQEHIEEQKLNKVAEQQYQQTLLQEDFEYNPKYVSESKVNPITGRPIPINVELLKYKPITLKPTHGNEVATIKFRGYEEDSLIRAGEFALRSAFYLGIPTSNLTSLKTEKRLYTVIKSPFAQAKTKQNFHRVTFNKTITAFDANPEVIDLWLSYINKHSIEGVKYEAKMITNESLDFSKELQSLDEIELSSTYNELNDPIGNKVKELLQSDNFKQFLKESK